MSDEFIRQYQSCWHHTDPQVKTVPRDAAIVVSVSGLNTKCLLTPFIWTLNGWRTRVDLRLWSSTLRRQHWHQLTTCSKIKLNKNLTIHLIPAPGATVLHGRPLWLIRLRKWYFGVGGRPSKNRLLRNIHVLWWYPWQFGGRSIETHSSDANRDANSDANRDANRDANNKKKEMKKLH